MAKEDIERAVNRRSLKAVLLAQLLSEALDDLQETTIYSRALKNLSNKLQAQLTPFCRKHYDAIYSEEVAESVDVIDMAISQIVNSALVENYNKVVFNLYLLKTHTGTIQVKSQLSEPEFRAELIKKGYLPK